MHSDLNRRPRWEEPPPLAGHRGYYGTPFFRYLDELEVGEQFYIHFYGRVLTYEVTGHEIILPTQTERLTLDPQKDRVTLLTCTPFGVGTHRLLIRGERVGSPTALPDGQPAGVPIEARSGDGVTETSATAGNHRYSSYALICVGSLAWITLFVMWMRTYRRKRV